jgi:hypothetical protein
MPPPNWDSLSTEAQNEIMAGAIAYHALRTEHHDYEHWVKVAKAVVQLRSAAAAAAGVDTNSLKHPAYRAAFKSLIRSELAGDLHLLDTTTMTHAAWLANNLANVEAWRKTLTDKERIALNHPTTIWRKHPDGGRAERAEKRMAREEPAGRKPSTAAAIEDAVGRLHNTVDDIERASGAAALSYDLSTPELVQESASNFNEVYGGVYGDDAVQRFADTLRPASRAVEPDSSEEIDGEAPRSILLCSFCGKSQHDVAKLVAGPRGSNICDKCVADCFNTLPPANRPVPSLPKFDDEWDDDDWDNELCFFADCAVKKWPLRGSLRRPGRL